MGKDRRLIRTIRTDRVIRAGMAMGLMVPAARSSFICLTSGGGGDFLFEIGLMGLLAGLVGIRLSSGKIKTALAAWAAPLLALMSVAVFLVSHELFAPATAFIVLIANLCLIALFYLSGRIIREQPADRKTAGPGQVSRLLFGFAAGAVLSSILLPVVGPFALFALFMVVLAPLMPPQGKWRYAVAPALLIMIGLAVADFTPVMKIIALREGGSGIVWRRWYADGPDEVYALSKRKIKTSVAGGHINWTTVISPSYLGRREARKSASAYIAGMLVSDSPVLILGPAAESCLYQSGEEMPGDRVVLAGDGRLTGLFNRTISRTGRGAYTRPAVISPSGIRRYLSGKSGRYGLIYYVDVFSRSSLAAGSVGRIPSYHLTVESLSIYLEALEDGGFLVLDVPYSLKIVSMLREIERRQGFQLEEQLLAYGVRGRSNDIIIFRKGPLDEEYLELLTGLARKKKLYTYYKPGKMRAKTSISRLVKTDHPHGYYAMGSEEFGPATDNRPFFYQVQKLIPRTVGNNKTGLAPRQKLRILGLFPPGDFPWVLFSAVCLLVWFLIFIRRRSENSEKSGNAVDWRHRFFMFFVLCGASFGLFAQGGLMAVLRDSITGAVKLPLGILVVFSGLGAGLFVACRAGRVVKKLLSADLRLMLPALFIPLATGLLPPGSRSCLLEILLAFVTLFPACFLGGMMLGRSLVLNNRHGAFNVYSCLAAGLLGALAGRELAAPISQTFGISFDIVLVWVVFFISIRILWRVPEESAACG